MPRKRGDSSDDGSWSFVVKNVTTPPPIHTLVKINTAKKTNGGGPIQEWWMTANREARSRGDKGTTGRKVACCSVGVERWSLPRGEAGGLAMDVHARMRESRVRTAKSFQPWGRERPHTWLPGHKRSQTGGPRDEGSRPPRTTCSPRALAPLPRG